MKTWKQQLKRNLATSMIIDLAIAFLMEFAVAFLITYPILAPAVEETKQSEACPDDLDANVHILVRSHCFNPTDGCLEWVFEMIGSPIELHPGGQRDEDQALQYPERPHQEMVVPPPSQGARPGK